MGKPNGKRVNKKSAFFDPLIERYNGDIFKAPERILINKMPVLVNDIVKGRVLYNKYGKYFTREFIYLLASHIITSYNNAVKEYDKSLVYSMIYPANSSANIDVIKWGQIVQAYTTLNGAVRKLHATGNVEEFLKLVPAQMTNFKNML